MTKPRLLLFDLGNVLVRLDLDRFSKSLGLDTRDARNHYGSGVRELTNQYEIGKCSTREYFSSLRSFLGNRYDVNVLEEAFMSVLADPMPGMENLVRRATAQLPAALVSNTNEYHFSRVLPRIPALNYLPKRYLSYQLGALKPFPEFYHSIVRNENVKPNEMLFIDDVVENVDAAERAGMAGYQFRNATELENLLMNLGVL
jgi:HAD superfamily hydrolase (TIGR01509 family)